MTSGERHWMAMQRVKAAMVGVLVVGFAAVFCTAYIFGLPAVARAAHLPVQVRDYSNTRLLEELGEADAVDACANVIAGMPQGFTARVYQDVAKQRLVVVCTPEGATP